MSNGSSSSSVGSITDPSTVLLQRRRWSGGVHGSVSMHIHRADPLTIMQPASPQFTFRHTLKSAQSSNFNVSEAVYVELKWNWNKMAEITPKCFENVLGMFQLSGFLTRSSNSVNCTHNWNKGHSAIAEKDRTALSAGKAAQRINNGCSKRGNFSGSLIHSMLIM